MSSIIVDTYYKSVETNLTKPTNRSTYLDVIDKHMARYAPIYSASGPGKRPAFKTDEAETVMSAMGISSSDIKATVTALQKSDSRWKIRGIEHPFLIATAIGLRFATIKKDDKMITAAISYFIVFNYPLLHAKYFKYEPSESIMEYVVNNMSNKYKLRKYGNLWGALYDMTMGAYTLHKDGLVKGDDGEINRLLTDIRTRLNGFMKNVRNEFEKAYRSGKHIQSESESFDEDNYHEADSNTLEVDVLSNQIVTKLVTVGPNVKLVKLAADMSEVSPSKLRSYVATMITSKHLSDIKTVVENLIYMYLTATDEKHTPDQIHTNDFTVYCMKVYKKSNTIDKNVIEIKRVLDRWIVELGIAKPGKHSTLTNNYRRALYAFFVLSIVDTR